MFSARINFHNISCRIPRSAATDRVLIDEESANRCNTRLSVSGVLTLCSCPALGLVILKHPVSRSRRSMFAKVVWCGQHFLEYCSWYILCARRPLPPAQP
ncbi:hypothetical protein AVEN_50445-1 [Araneus ventricosus]|uniref:Uncharacterized protein n=1 Tax=Araneus ventricosus TaxID=182803 RepID=A0A4Y2H518_ARAVE|nr:hypothetical protein AVEN_50445-1 [Araneus ventricosus]